MGTKEGQLLRAWRVRNGLSQEAAGRLLGVGKPMVCHWEKGKRKLGEETLARALAWERERDRELGRWLMWAL